MKMTKLKYSILGILAAIAAWLGWNVYAVDTDLTWTNPTTFTDGSPIPDGDLASARIYRKVDTGTYGIYQTIPIGTSFKDADLANGVYCYKVSVVRTNGIESPQSNEACKTVDTRIPNAVTISVN